MDILDRIYQWEFMNEPLPRWFMFLGAFIAMLAAWRGVLHFFA